MSTRHWLFLVFVLVMPHQPPVPELKLQVKIAAAAVGLGVGFPVVVVWQIVKPSFKTEPSEAHLIMELAVTARPSMALIRSTMEVLDPK